MNQSGTLQHRSNILEVLEVVFVKIDQSQLSKLTELEKLWQFRQLIVGEVQLDKASTPQHECEVVGGQLTTRKDQKFELLRVFDLFLHSCLFSLFSFAFEFSRQFGP